MQTNGINTLEEARIEVPVEIAVSDCANEVLEKCRDFLLDIGNDAQRSELRGSLEAGFARINGLAEGSGSPARLFADGAPLSFGWQAGGLVGGLLFHGSHDGFGSGAAPTFAVTLTPTNGWSIHT